jgi:putative transcriptional regulator
VKNELRVLREVRGWTQAALADRLDVSRQTVNALETGKYDPSLPLAFRIARIFALPIEQIFFPDEPDGPGEVDLRAVTVTVGSRERSGNMGS